MINQKELLLRGYVSPADFPETSEPLQAALQAAETLDVRKVVVDADLTARSPVVIPPYTHLVIENATVRADFVTARPESVSFMGDRVYIEGRNGRIKGSVSLYGIRHGVIEHLAMEGNITLAFVQDARIEDVTLSGTVTLARGTAKVIAQRITASAAVIDSRNAGEDVIGIEPTVRSVALRDSRFSSGIKAIADPEYGLLNVQIDHVAGDVTVGDGQTDVPAEKYFNLTVTDIDGKVEVLSPTVNLTL